MSNGGGGGGGGSANAHGITNPSSSSSSSSLPFLLLPRGLPRLRLCLLPGRLARGAVPARLPGAVMFLQRPPTARWGKADVEPVLSRAFYEGAVWRGAEPSGEAVRRRQD